MAKTNTPPLPDDQPCDLRLLTPSINLRELPATSPITPPTTANVSLPLFSGTLPSQIVQTTGGAYTCSRCGNSYARPHSLNRHIRFECGVEPKFECPICHKKSKHKHNLVLHMRTHQHR